MANDKNKIYEQALKVAEEKESIEWGDINTEWGDGGVNLNYTQKHKASSNIIDFSTKERINEAMRFDVVDSINFEVPKKNESFFGLTTKAMSLLDILNYIENKEGVIEEAYFFLYTINKKMASYCADLSKRAKLNIIISDLMNSKREKENLINEILYNSSSDVVFCHSHAKVIAFKIGDDNYVISGSMNAGNNARIEQFQISNNESVYKMIAKTHKKLSSEFSIKKRYNAIRH